MPKSGSTFLKETLCKLTGWPDTFLYYAYLRNFTCLIYCERHRTTR